MKKPTAHRVIRAIAIWLPTCLLSLLFAMQGAMKLFADTPWPSMFEGWGYPAGSHLVVGFLELAGAILMLVPRRGAWGATLLGTVMLGAAGTHLLHQEWTQAIFTTVLTALCLVLAWARMPKERIAPIVQPG